MLPDAANCGPESTYVLLSVFGRKVRLADVEAECRSLETRVSLYSIDKALRNHGLWTLAVHGEAHQYGTHRQPGIGYLKGDIWPDGHFFAFVKDGRNLRVFVPPQRLRSVSVAGLCASPSNAKRAALLVYPSFSRYLLGLLRVWSRYVAHRPLPWCICAALTCATGAVLFKTGRVKWSLGLVGAFALLGGITAEIHGHRFERTNHKPVLLAAELSDIDLGTAVGSPRKEFRFRVENRTSKTLELAPPKASCACIESLSLSPQKLGPREQGVVTGTYVYPVSGSNSAEVFVSARGRDKALATVRVSGVSVPEYTLDRTRLHFGFVSTESIPRKTMIFRGFANAAGRFARVTAVRASQSWLKATFESASELDMREPVNFTAYRITVTPSPDAPAGPFAATVTLETDAEAERGRTVVIPVSGLIQTN